MNWQRGLKRLFWTITIACYALVILEIYVCASWGMAQGFTPEGYTMLFNQMLFPPVLYGAASLIAWIWCGFRKVNPPT